MIGLALIPAPRGAAWAQSGQVEPAEPNTATTPDSLYRAARVALNQGEYATAADLLQQLRARYPDSPHLADALYWEAFARYRLGGATQLRGALARLVQQQEAFPEAATGADARALISRILGELARLGDANAVAAIRQSAADAARPRPLAPLIISLPADTVVIVPPASPAPAATIVVEASRQVASINRDMASLNREIAAIHRDFAAVQREMANAMRGAARGSLQLPGKLPDDCSREDAEIRATALNALLMTDAERALPVLQQVLARRDTCSTPLRRTAVFLVAQKVDSETEKILLETARRDPDLTVRKNAVFHLSQVGTERAITLLEEILDSPADSALQEQAIFALSQHRDQRAQKALRAYAARDDAPNRLRGVTIFWVGQDQSAESLIFLKNLYRKLQDEQLKSRILHSVAQRGEQSNTTWLLEIALDNDSPLQIRTTALHHAGTRSDAPINDIVALYDRLPERKLREQLIFILTQRKEPEAIDKMFEIARQEPDTALRKTAIHWLAQSRDPRVTDLLLELIGGT